MHYPDGLITKDIWIPFQKMTAVNFLLVCYFLNDRNLDPEKDGVNWYSYLPTGKWRRAKTISPPLSGRGVIFESQDWSMKLNLPIAEAPEVSLGG